MARNAAPRRLGRFWLLLALAYPAVFVNLDHGQNGFLTAALLGTALWQLDRRPWLAGVLIGLMVYKPQFGLLIPVVLIASGRWRTFAAAALTVIALTLIVTLAFGPARHRHHSRHTLLPRLRADGHRTGNCFPRARRPECGLDPWKKKLLAAVWFVPLIARSVAGATLIPLAVPTLLIAFVLHCAMVETGALKPWHFKRVTAE